VAGRKAAYKTIQEKAAAAAATANPLILIGRTIVVSPKITGVTFFPGSVRRGTSICGPK